MSESRIGIGAEVLSAMAAVTYPIVRVVSGYVTRRRIRTARRYAAAARVVELRLLDRCGVLEDRVRKLEESFKEAA